MSRVEWTRLAGDDVEAVVAMFVNRDHPRSVRITPSQGDGGVDIIDPGAGVDGTNDVYQVKRYTRPLTSAQKKSIEGSLRRLLTDPRWAAVKLRTWHLVMPWDPSPEAYQWFTELAATHGVDAVWDGLTYADNGASRYPDIIDYYLHGGRTRIAEAYQAVSALDRLDRRDGDDGDQDAPGVEEVARRVEKALAVLDTDPHYRYELRFGEGEPPADSPGRPGLMLTMITGRVGGGQWTAVDVIARCAASAEVRPITITGKFVVPVGDPFADVLADFFDYGTPFTSPEGVYEGDFDAPGGLGGSIEGATVTAFAPSREVGDSPGLHLEALDPDGAVLASVDLDRIERSSAGTGVRIVLREVHGAFTFEDRYNLRDQTGSRNVRFGDFDGAPVAAVHKALTFLTHCRNPNVGRLSVRHTPPELGVVDPNLGFDWPAEKLGRLTAMVDVLADLLTIQDHTSAIVCVPNLDERTATQVPGWQAAAAVLRGNDVLRRYPDGPGLLVEMEKELSDTKLAGPVTIAVPFTVDVGDTTIDLGRVGAVLDEPTLVNKTNSDDKVVYTFSTPDRIVRYQQLPREA